MKSGLLLVGAGIAIAGLARAGFIQAQRGTGSWSSPINGADFDVWTFEVMFGGWYGEFVWGWWPCR